MLATLLLIPYIALSSIMVSTYLLPNQLHTGRIIRPFLMPLLFLYALFIPGPITLTLCFALLALFAADLTVSFFPATRLPMLILSWCGLIFLGLTLIFSAGDIQISPWFIVLAVLLTALIVTGIYFLFRGYFSRFSIISLLYLTGSALLLVAGFASLFAAPGGGTVFILVGVVLTCVSSVLAVSNGTKVPSTAVSIWMDSLMLLGLCLIVTGLLYR